MYGWTWYNLQILRMKSWIEWTDIVGSEHCKSDHASNPEQDENDGKHEDESIPEGEINLQRVRKQLQGNSQEALLSALFLAFF